MIANARIIRDAGDLAKLTPHWWKLWNSIPQTTVFQSPAWILPWWEVFEPGRLRCITVWDDDRLIGLAPMYLESGRFGERLLPIGIGLSDYCDVLLAPDCTAEAAGVLASAFDELGEWQICQFPELLADACAFELPAPRACQTQIVDGSVAPILPVAAAGDLFDVIPASQSRKVRRARATVSKCAASGITQCSGDAARQALVELIRLHTAHWNTRGEGGVFADPRVRKFHTCALPELLAQGLARLYSLSIGERVIAVYYGFVHRDRAYAYLEGYDPQFAKFSPGNLVIAHAIVSAIRERATEFHFLRGEEAYKFEWGARRRVNQTRIFSRQEADS